MIKGERERAQARSRGVIARFSLSAGTNVQAGIIALDLNGKAVLASAGCEVYASGLRDQLNGHRDLLVRRQSGGSGFYRYGIIGIDRAGNVFRGVFPAAVRHGALHSGSTGYRSACLDSEGHAGRSVGGLCQGQGLVGLVPGTAGRGLFRQPGHGACDMDGHSPGDSGPARRNGGGNGGDADGLAGDPASGDGGNVRVAGRPLHRSSAGRGSRRDRGGLAHGHSGDSG